MTTKDSMHHIANLLVDDDKGLVGAITDLLLELNDLLHTLVNEGPLGFYELLTLY